MDGPLEPPTRLDKEPEVLWGCTQPELFVLIGIGLACAIPIGLLFALVARYGLVSFGHLSIPLIGVLTYALVRLGAARLRQLKRGRPDHYYRLRMHFWLVGLGLVTARFITHSGPWRLGRS
jgi:conjugative transfer region protein (TIGR03750 family)